MYSFKVFTFFLLIICITDAWYTCDDLDFCKNIRTKKNDSSSFKIDESSSSVSDDNSTYTANLINLDNNGTLKLTFTCLEDDTFRLTINDPNKKRHVMSDALDGEPRKKNCDNIAINTGYVIIDSSIHNVFIFTDSFKIEVYSGKKAVMSINSKNKIVFNSNDNEAVALDVALTGQVAYGLPEHAERLALKTTKPGGLNPYRLFNADYPGYAIESQESLYGAIPVLYGHGMKRSSGVFWLNSAQTYIDVDTDEGVQAYFISESGAIDLFILTGPTLEKAVQQYTKLTGTAPLPQLFALGFHQSRWNYDNQSDVLGVVSGFDKNNFPLDVMWLDIEYTDNKKYFTWDPVNFANPLQMQEVLNSTGRKLVVIIDPHIKVEKGYSVYEEALANGYFVKNIDGSTYEGSCWPGLSSYIDFMNPAARHWYSKLYSLNNFINTTLNTYIWNDMNEPSVFDVEEKTMPLNGVKHYGDWLHRDVHNAYGFYQTMGTYAGLLERSQNKLRPFILTRSHFAGSQRYTAMWTGDNNADWDYLRISVPMCLTEALAGMSFCGADVGGFNNDVEDELFQRWYQAGAWLPFYRSHSTLGTKRREPYLYSKDIQQRFRSALKQRYAHLPYWYTLWWEHYKTGSPVIRPLSYHFLDPYVLKTDQSWLVGENILVSPVMEKGANEITVYLPGNVFWYYDKVYEGGKNYTLPVTIATVPVFYKGGSVIVKKDTVRSSSVYMHDDDLSLYVMLDENDEASGTLYVDDYESFNYKNRVYLYVRFDYKDSLLKLNKIDVDAHYDTNEIITNVYIYGPALKRNASLVNGNEAIPLKSSYDSIGNRLTLTDLKLNLTKPFEIRFD